jgi:hypothetical protein
MRERKEWAEVTVSIDVTSATRELQSREKEIGTI